MNHQHFFITQDAIIINKKGEVLILLHKSGKWLLPGGKINKGETWLEGLKREIKEETGIINFKIKKIMDVSSWLEPEIGYYVVTFLCSTSPNPEIVLSDEHQEYAWTSLSNLDHYTFYHPDIKKRIQKSLLELLQKA
jgi:8-oxo-dGTP diphosphatase